MTGKTKQNVVAWLVLVCLFCTAGVFAPGESFGLSKAGALLSRADRSFTLLKSRKSRQKYRHHYENTEKLYRKVFDNHPETREAQRALLRCGELFTLLYRWTSGKSDLGQARDYYQRLLRDYPDGDLADDSLVALGFLELNYYNDPPAAYRLFSQALTSYPRGDRAKEARRWLGKLKRYAPAAAKTPSPPPSPSSSRAATLLKEADRRFSELKKKKSLQKYRHHYDKVLARYRKVFEGYRDAREAPTALLRSGELFTLLYRWTSIRDDLDSSRQYYQRLLQDYPDSALADDAQIAIAYLYRDHYGNKTKAYEEFEKVILLSPRGDRKGEAEKALKKLGAYRPRRSSAAVPTPVSPSDGTAVVRGIRHWSNPTYTRVVIDLDRTTNFYSHFLRESSSQGKPPRLYIDLFKSSLGKNHPGSIPVNDGILLSIRAGQYKADTVRVVLDIDQLKSHQIFAMENPFRIVIDATGGGKGPRRAASPTGVEPRKTPAKGPFTLAQQLGLGVSRVVIDPGHGAHDPGAVGVKGLKEKDIVLDIALRLRNLLQRAGLETILTREKDVYLGLEERTAIANRSNSDLFVSIHANSSKRSNLKGVETYYLDIARSQRAMETAALENSMSLAKMSDLEGILEQLFNTKKDESSRLAGIVQKNIVKHLQKHFSQVRDLGVKKAPFYVLIGAQMPSILAEVSFINHPVEGKRLATESYRQRIAEALSAGIQDYIRTVKTSASAGR